MDGQLSFELNELTDEVSEEVVRCKNCNHEITKARYAIEPHEHTFRNPAGFSFHVLCYSDAPGAGNVGTPTTKDSWFEDHAWSFALCNGCNTHVGWWYRGKSSFVGLIATRLIR